MSRSVWCRQVLLAWVLAGLAQSGLVCQAADESAAPDSDSALYLKVQLSNPPKYSHMKPGDVVDGTLARDLYWGDQKMFSVGSGIQLTVDHLTKRTRPRNDHWPWIVQLFTPRHMMYPVFNTASIVQSGKASYPLQVSLLSAAQTKELRAHGHREKKSSGLEKPKGTRSAVPVLIFRAESANALPYTPIAEDAGVHAEAAGSISIPAGTRCQLLLLGGVSASKSRPGDVVSARLLAPLLVDNKPVLPAGSVFIGKVLKKTPPRRLSRAGSLALSFNQVTLPHGERVLISASLVGAELDQRSHTTMDAEGHLHGERPGKAWMAINLGVSAGISKEVDDGAQLLLEALISTATDASTAGAARIASSCASGIYMATRHGRDVVLPAFTEVEVSLDRALTLSARPQMEVAAAPRSRDE